MPFQICRVCYKRGYDFLSLEDDDHNYEQKLSFCIPEIDIHIIDNPGICQICADMLNIAFKLRNICLENEKRYNSTFNERINKSVISNELVDSNNEDTIEESCAQDLINETDDSQNLLSVAEIRTEAAILCSICNKTFSSNHDKKLHDFKLHRQLQHKNLLSPFDKNLNNMLSIKQQNIINKTIDSILNDEDSDLEYISENVSNVNTDQNTTTNSCIKNDPEFTNNHEYDSYKSKDLEKSCYVCKKIFNKENELNNHVKSHVIECCGQSFPTTSILQLHTYKEHNMTCGICNEQFIQLTVMFNHLLDHVKYLSKCHICGKKFKTNQDSNEHNCQHYECQFCNTIYLTVEAYDEHAKIHHNEVESTNSTISNGVSCRKCNTFYETRALYAKHRHSVHKFRKYSQHFETDQYFNERNCEHYECQFCNKIYLTMEAYNEHANIHQKDVESSNILTMSVESPYTIARSESSNNTIARSVESSDSTITRGILCKKCNKFYKTRALLAKHMHTNHKFGRTPQEKNNTSIIQKKYTCYLCEKEYKLHLHLKFHIFNEHCNKVLTIPIVDCRKDTFYKEQEGLQINFDIPSEYSKVMNIPRSKFIIRTKRICFICRTLFERLPLLYAHAENQHSSCCNKDLTSVNLFVHHNFTHYNQEEKDGNHAEILCLACKRKFKNYSLLIAHNCSEIRKSKKKKIKAIEEKEGNKRCTIELHEADEYDRSECIIYENDSGLNRIVCQICETQFHSKSDLLDHVKIHI